MTEDILEGRMHPLPDVQQAARRATRSTVRALMLLTIFLVVLILAHQVGSAIGTSLAG
jgi:uncharacterized membrane protein